ncbi:MAG: hypothetical protein AAB588_04965 [Patescibacteria group bacterium]
MPLCKNCQQDFVIAEEDRAYYAKIEVPEPTWCPPCREMRRMAWCNERVLYPRECLLCGKKIIAQLAPTNPRPVYCVECWWSDKWDCTSFGREIDWNRSFFEQIHELELAVPHCCVSIDIGAVNSEYTHHAGQEKNCYLIFHATFAEDCYYGYGVKKAKNCVDVHYCHQSEVCYECIDVKECYGLGWCQDCSNCSTSYFLRDCVGCMDCFMCTGLRNKKYCFMNEQLTQEEYQRKMAAMNLASQQTVKEYLRQFGELQKKHTYRYLQNNMLENSLGDHLYNAKDSHYCFDCSDIEKSKYCSQMQLGVKYCYDIYMFGVGAELCYEGAVVGTNAYNVRFCYLCLWQVTDLTYCLDSYSSKDCIGCFGLNHKQYCILNKSYSKEEYFELKEKAIEKMKADGEYGEFFPIQYSQSAYNETTAQLWYPMTKEEVVAKGWQWQDELPGTYGKETVQNIADDIRDIPDSITQEVLACESCGKNYRILAQELAFYRSQKYPIPRCCFDCRRLARMRLRNPRKLWQRQCMCKKLEHGHEGVCTVKFETTYAPEREEVIYCEHCYQQTIY